MTDRELIQNLQVFKTIKPNTDWAISARQELINHIETSSFFVHVFETTLARPAFAGAFAAFSVLLMVGGLIWTQSSIPGSKLYRVKLVSEDVRGFVATNKAGFEASRAQERVEEASKLASERLSDQDKVAVAQKLENYKKSLEEVKKAGNEAVIAKTAQEVGEQTRILTSAISEIDSSNTLAETLRAKTEERLALCGDKAFAEEISELLEEGSVSSLISATELSFRCE